MTSLSFDTVLIANRGEIAIRFIRALHDLNLRAAAVFVSDDATSPHVRLADVAHNLGASPALYTDIASMLRACKELRAGAVLPGYGFLSENAAAARAFEEAGVVWLGPAPSTIELFGLKHTARAAAVAAGVPIVPGSRGVLQTAADVERAVDQLGLPLLLKATAGGGGMGQAVVTTRGQAVAAFETVTAQARALFGCADVFAERYVRSARHVEVQVFGDGRGGVIAVGDRDCTMQRRRQKIIEEGPAPDLPDETRTGLRQAAASLCQSVNYRSAGTVEFIVDAENPQNWYFLEVNTRLQVEHGVTEMVSGVDLARSMIMLGGCDTDDDNAAEQIDTLVMSGLRIASERGACVEARVYAENPVAGYAPGAGTVSWMSWPDDQEENKDNKDPQSDDSAAVRIRVDRWAERGVKVSAHYDPMLGKVLVWGVTRAHAIRGLVSALRRTKVRGVPSNIELLIDALQSTEFRGATHTTRLLDTGIRPRARAMQVITPGLQTSVQDYPGRVGYWSIGVSPSGPMDAYAMGMANALVGNDPGKSALEITVSGPTLKFHTDAVIALGGAALSARVDAAGDATEWHPLPYWTPTRVPAGAVVEIGVGAPEGYGKKREAPGGKTTYLAVRGGIDAPHYLGSAATFPTGRFGGVTGSFLAAGDMLPLTEQCDAKSLSDESAPLDTQWPEGVRLHESFVPRYTAAGGVWEVGALNGPHGSEDFLKQDTLAELWQVPYEVQHATNRLGARLLGPVPQWTRADGGSAGLHPSNLHDYVYAPGALNLSGNTPIVLMLDGPSLGGFVCPLTVASAELWKVAQAQPGDKLRFRPIKFDAARAAMRYTKRAWASVQRYDIADLDRLAKEWTPWWVTDKTTKKATGVMVTQTTPTPAILAKLTDTEFDVVYRMSGDEHVLVEYGAIDLDLAYRIRVHLLMRALEGRSYIRELCPGVRSLLVRYDRDEIHIDDLTKVLTGLETGGTLGLVKDVELPSRVIELPLAFEDQWTVEAQQRYLRSVRPDAPYMPSNVEFMRRINGLGSVDEVRDIMCAAEYMVLGLGDVYLGAPCAVPVDPRHRMVTSKYNPARTYTPEGAVGIGGAYMCIYGMDSPGGYQLAGRTLPIWDSYGTVPETHRGSPRDIPWLLRFFDRVKFFPVADDELQRMREAYRNGAYKISVTHEKFSYATHAQFLRDNKDSITAFEDARNAAYNAERARWDAEGEGASDAAARHAGKDNSNGESAAEPGKLKNGVTDETIAEDDENGNVSGGGDAGATENGQKRNEVAIRAGMAANVWLVGVAVGDRVQHGDQVVSLESMKVEMSIRAPIAGVVSAINVSKGDSVDPDDVLIRLSVVDDDDDDEQASRAAKKGTKGGSGGDSIAQLRKRVELGLTSYARETAKCVTRARGSGLIEVVSAAAAADHDVAVEEQGGLYGVAFVAGPDAPQAVVSAVRAAGAVFVGTTKGGADDVSEAIATGAGMFGIELVHHKSGCNGSAEQPIKTNNSALTTMWVSNGMLPTVRNDSEGDGDDQDWTAKSCVRLTGRCVADIGAVLRNAMAARQITRAPHLLLPLPQSNTKGGGDAGRIGACRYPMASADNETQQEQEEAVAAEQWGRLLESQVWSEMNVLAVMHGKDSDGVDVTFAEKMVAELGCCALHGRLLGDDEEVVTLVGRTMDELQVVGVAASVTGMHLKSVMADESCTAVRLLRSII